MLVYILVETTDYEGESLQGVYLSEDKANVKCNEYNAKNTMSHIRYNVYPELVQE